MTSQQQQQTGTTRLRPSGAVAARGEIAVVVVDVVVFTTGLGFRGGGGGLPGRRAMALTGSARTLCSVVWFPFVRSQPPTMCRS